MAYDVKKTHANAIDTVKFTQQDGDDVPSDTYVWGNREPSFLSAGKGS